MVLCLGLLADLAAAHGHEYSAKDIHIDPKSAASPRAIMSAFTAPSQCMSVFPRSKEPRPLSAGSATPMSNIKFIVLEDSVPPTEDNESTSRSSSITGSGVVATRGRRPVAASKTSFRLAHPPPAVKHRQRFNIRPKILLQLQQISEATRPTPILDVLPSVVFAPRLARKFPGIFRGKDGLGPDDLIVVNSQNYELSNSNNGKLENISEDDSWETREIVAAICQPKKRVTGNDGATEICLNHGPSWDASLLATGAYEFVSIDEKGERTVARWVPRPPISRRQSYNGQDNSSIADQRRFTFSLINPGSRRHPVIATLSRSSIDISNRYSVSAPISPTARSISPQNQNPASTEARHAHFNEHQLLKTTMIETDDLLRTLIVITGIWVAFKEGYSPSFKYSKPIVSPSASNSPPSHRPRSFSINLSSVSNARTTHVENPVQEKNLHESSAARDASLCSSTPASPSKDLPRMIQPQRAYSTGTAFLQRANTRRSYPSVKTLPENTQISSGNDEPQKSPCPFRHAKDSIEKQVPTPANSTKIQDDCIVDNSRMSTALPIMGNTCLPAVAALPMTAVVRKPSRVNKLFRYIRRASGLH